MTPLPAALGGRDLVAWRLDSAVHAETWDSGEGAHLAGGRWNTRGLRAVYCSLDPATAILEVAVHKGFEALDRVPHVITEIVVHDVAELRVVWPGDIPNANWLHPGIPGAGQQAFGNDLLGAHRIVVIPSAVSTRSWNLIFERTHAAGLYSARSQTRFALDTRLNPPAAAR